MRWKPQAENTSLPQIETPIPSVWFLKMKILSNSTKMEMNRRYLHLVCHVCIYNAIKIYCCP